MIGAFAEQGTTRIRRMPARLSTVLTNAARTAGPALLFGLRLWASVCLALYVAFWLELPNPSWAGTTAGIVCQRQLGASLRKGWYRMIGTLVGAVVVVVLTAWFPQDRVSFLVALALWCAGCVFVATVLHNFAAYAAALAGYTAVIIAADELGATGGPNADEVFVLAVTRATEICVGIVSAGIVLAGTDLGGARRRLAASLADLAAEIIGRFIGMLTRAGPDLPDTRASRRELVRRVIALEPIIDQAKGESSQIRYHSPILQRAVDGLFSALVAWRTVAVLLARMPNDQAKQEAATVLRSIPQGLRSAEHGTPTDWLTEPLALHRDGETAAQRLAALPCGTVSLHLLADQTAKVLAGISDALNGLALLAAVPVRLVPRHRRLDIRVPDWLPPFVNAGRAFVVIVAVQLFWIVTEWPNGATAISFAAIAVLLFAARGDQAYSSAMDFIIGVFIGTIFGAIIKFAVLPGLESFEALAIVFGLYLIPGGILMARPWHSTIFTYMTAYFCVYINPTNAMSYDSQQYYNTVFAIVFGSAVAALSFRLLPPLSPPFRTRRLLALTLRDLRRFAAGRTSWAARDWESRMYGRLEALPNEAEPLQRAQLLAALTLGTEIIGLRRVESQLGFGSELDSALAVIAAGNSPVAAANLAELDARLASWPGDATTSMPLHARASILAISQALDEHAAYFDQRVPR